MNAPNVGLSPEPQFTVDFGTVSFLTRLTMYYPPFKTGIVCGTDNDAMQLEGEHQIVKCLPNLRLVGKQITRRH